MMTIDSIRSSLTSKQFSAEELTRQALAYAEAENPKTNAYLTMSPERALAAALEVDKKIAAGEDPGPLAGVPIAIKDVIVTRSVRTTCGSRLLENYIPPYDATAVTRIEQAGGIILGKTNCDEFAMGSSNENSAFGPVRNPVAPDRVPGGSSGGSAAVVAQGTAVLSLGSDTGGSVRQPASFCGVVGVTPTYGRVSRYGLTAFASSLDHIGPFARSVKDAATLLRVIAGRDEMDATSAFAPVPDYAATLDGNVRGMKIGLPREYFENLESETGDVIHRAVEVLKKLGCEIKEVRLPHTEYAIATYYIIATAEASSNLARYDGVRYTSRAAASETLGGHVSQHARRRIRRGMQAADYAGNVRAECRLLRRLLSEGSKSAEPDRAGSRRGVRTGGRDRGAGVAVSRHSNWAKK